MSSHSQNPSAVVSSGPNTSTANVTVLTGPTVLQQGPSSSNNLEYHHHLQINQQPMDLAPRGPSVVQLRPVRPVFTPNLTNKQQTLQATAIPISGTPIISVNRTTPANLTLLQPARPQQGAGQVQISTVGAGPGGNPQAISTYQITRVGNVRAGGQQPASITVTPISSNISANIRLAGATVNNGTWASSGSFSPIRAATITVGGRAIRPDGKMIHIPQPNVQHVTQLQMVNSKGSILKPTTPILNIRGPLPGGGNTVSSVTVPLPLPPFTNRNFPTIQQRPQTSITTNKVIQQVHNAPIQFVNANKSSHLLQAITPLPKLNTVCLTLPASGNIVSNNSGTPIVAVARQNVSGGSSLIMTPSTTRGGLPMTKVYPMDTIFATANPNNHQSSSGSVTVSTVNVSATPTSVVVATPHQQQQQQHLQIVHTPTINVQSSGLPPPNMAPGSIAPSYYVDKNFVVQTHHNPHLSQSRPIALDQKKGGGQQQDFLQKGHHLQQQSLPMIFTSTNQPPSVATLIQSSGQTLTIPIAPHGMIPISQQNHHTTHQILTHIQQGPHPHHPQLTSFTAVSSTPSITVTGPVTVQNHLGGHNHSHHSFIQAQPQSFPAVSLSNSNNNNGPHPHLQQNPYHQPQQQSISTSTSVLTVTTTTISSNSGNGSTNNNNTITAPSVSVCNTTLTSSSSSSSSLSNPTNSSSTSTTCSSTTTTTTTSSSSTSQPAQSPNQKSTHSPRPSILRKRELVGESHLSSRAQRNLTMSLNFAATAAANNHCNSGSASANKENAIALVERERLEKNTTMNSSTTCSSSNYNTTIINTSSSNLSSTNNSNCGLMSGLSNLVGSGNGGGGGGLSLSGISILKKEFQPPTEESSWQSVSSNSSSGSSTISTTSETAELQMQQQQQLAASSVLVDFSLHNSSNSNIHLNIPTSHSSMESLFNPNQHHHHHHHNLYNPSQQNIMNTTSSSSTSFAGATSNGVVRGGASSAPRSGRSNSTSNKASSKDMDRIKSSSKDKEDSVSPRKRSRKQQLTSSDLLETASPEIYYQGKGKGKFRKSELMDFTEGVNEKLGIEPTLEEVPPPRVVYYLKKKHMSLLKFNSIPSKPITNHFQKPADVKPKDEKRPTISDLSNQKGILQKVGGWRLQHVTAQMNDVIEVEDSVVTKFSSCLARLEERLDPNCEDGDLNRVIELLKGNIQRCKVIRDQMTESRVQALKILEHKPHLVQVINKYSSKRPHKKRDRL